MSTPNPHPHPNQVVPAYYDLLRAPNEQQAQARQYSLLQALSELENLLLTRQGVGTAEEPFPSGPFLCDDFSLAEVRVRDRVWDTVGWG